MGRSLRGRLTSHKHRQPNSIPSNFRIRLRSLLDCPVPRLTLLFFGAAKDVPEAAKMVTAGTACLHLDQQANGQTGHSFQVALRPLKKCITKEITAIISKR